MVHLHKCMHLALAATRDLRLVSSPDVLTDGFVELSCSTLYCPFLASAVSSFALLEYLIAPPWVQTSPVVTSPALGFSTSMRCSTLRFTSFLDFSLHSFRLQHPRYSMDTQSGAISSCDHVFDSFVVTRLLSCRTCSCCDVTRFGREDECAR